MTVYPLPTLAVSVTIAGISAPAFNDILLSLQASYRSVYGADVYLGNDSQDGQWLGIQAKAINDNNNACIAVYNAYSPTTAKGVGLSSVVKINGLSRLISTNSQASVLVSGTGGTVVLNGLVGDNQNLGTQWALPSVVNIPLSGSVTVLATCTSPGAVTASDNTLTKILTPTRGWGSVNNPSDASAGNPVESDAILRQRQAKSTSLPSITTAAGILASIANLPGVGRVTAYINSTGSTDGNGIPARSVDFVIEGGDPVAIATIIALKKAPGTRTFGGTTEVIVDSAGVTNSISFDVLQLTEIDIVITLHQLAGWSAGYTQIIRNAVRTWIDSLSIGEPSYTGRLFSPANLNGDAAVLGTGMSQAQLDAVSATYNLINVRQCLHGGSPASTDLTPAFNAAFFVSFTDITFVFV